MKYPAVLFSVRKGDWLLYILYVFGGHTFHLLFALESLLVHMMLSQFIFHFNTEHSPHLRTAL